MLVEQFTYGDGRWQICKLMRGQSLREGQTISSLIFMFFCCVLFPGPSMRPVIVISGFMAYENRSHVANVQRRVGRGLNWGKGLANANVPAMAPMNQSLGRNLTSCSILRSRSSRVFTAVQSCCISLKGSASSPASGSSSRDRHRDTGLGSLDNKTGN